jgi:SAM-dependent methyltransferase
MIPTSYSFIRYLIAKKFIDDRSLNAHVWDSLLRALPPGLPDRPLRVLEIGAGIGTMLERMIGRDMLTHAIYTSVDAMSDNTAYGLARLPAWGSSHGFPVTTTAAGDLMVSCCGAGGRGQVVARLVTADVFDFVNQYAGQEKWDLLIAHAFLDLVDLSRALPLFFQLLRPGGLFYFSLNFDGATILEPLLDPALDRQIETLYHQTMDERISAGQPSGDSCSGRHLYGHILRAGGQVLRAGASDWVVFPSQGEYHQDEAYFLHFIIHTIGQALVGRPGLDAEKFNAWVTARHAQIENRQLVYIAHQIDYLGQR